jgi:hypothetical protein
MEKYESKPTTVDDDRQSSTLKWKKIPIILEEVHICCDENWIKICPEHHLVI